MSCYYILKKKREIIMKKILFLLSILTVFTSCTLSTPAISASENEKGYISISTSAESDVTPDTAEISFAIITDDPKSLQKATLDNKNISDNVYKVLNSLININNGDSIKTSDFHATPVYSYSGNKKTLVKYEVSNRITVKTKSLDTIGALIDKTVKAGANKVDSLNFSVSNYENHCNKLIENAIVKAKNRANSATKNIPAHIVGVKHLDVSCNPNNTNYPRVYTAKNTLTNNTDSIIESYTNISLGTVKIYANVNISFFIK